MGRFIPRGSGPHGSRGKAVWSVLLAFGLLAAAPGGLFAQAPESPRTFYFPERSFYIPFSLHENDPRLEILLNVSRDEGRTYHYSASARPPDRRFHFKAPADGWYYFIVQTRDASGALTPEKLTGVPPSIRVCVDTQPPVIESLTADAPSDNSPPTIRWKITETNLKEIWADYRSTAGGDWVPMFLPLKEEGAAPWKPLWGGQLEVRMMATDQAGHRSEVRTLPLRVANNVTRMPPPQDPVGAGKVMFVRSKEFQLHYTLDSQTVGPSKVASVDIWKLHRGQGWRKCPKPGPPNGPATVSVDAAGRWGFRLIPRSGVDLHERDPQPGDAPDIWVEVDDKPPRVQVTNVTVTQEADGGYLTVYWMADDAFLRAMPITIFLASPPQGGDWNPVASGLPNTGSWRQKIDDLKLGDRYEFALKVAAIDEAGNTGESQWRDTVKMDLKIPRIKSIELQIGGATAGGQQTHGTAGTTSAGGFPFDNDQATPKQAPSSLNATNQNFSQVKPGKP
jgi:hypothetical protein